MDQQLINASENGNVNEVRRLIEAGANPAADDNDAIQIAAENGHTEVVRLLLADRRTDPSAHNNYAIRSATSKGYLEVVQLLLADPRVDPSAIDNFAIRSAASKGYLEVVQLLLADPRVDLSANDNVSIRLAAANGQTEIVRLLASQPGVLLPTANYFLQNTQWKNLKQLASMTGVFSDSPEDLMVWGAAIGSLPLVQSLIEQGIDPSADDNSAIRSAVQYGKTEVVQLLASQPGILLPTVNYYLQTNQEEELKRLAKMTGVYSDSKEDLMVWGAAIGSLPLVQSLIEQGVDVTFADNSAMAAVIQYNQPEIEDYLKSLLNQELIDASKDGNVNKIQQLLEAGADPAAENNEAIREAALEGHTEVVRLLLADHRVDPSAKNNEAIRLAASGEHTEVVQLLLADPRVDPSAFNNETIRLAALYGKTEVVQLLLADPRVDPSDDDNYAIQYAASEGHAEIVQLLLADLRVDPSADNNFAIRRAAMNGHADVVQLLLADQRVDPAANDDFAIRWAARNGHTEAVQLLLDDIRVDPTAMINEVIRWAAMEGHTEIVRLLANQPGVLLPTVNYYLQNNQEEELKRLAKMTGASSDSPEDLMVWGSAIGSLPLVTYLIDQGVDPTYANNSALVAARNNNHSEIISYLSNKSIAHRRRGIVQRNCIIA